MLRRRPDWSRRLPQPLTIPEVMDLRTLADVRELLTHLPERCRDKSTWQHVIACLEEAALDISRTDACIEVCTGNDVIGFSLLKIQCGAAH